MLMEQNWVFCFKIDDINAMPEATLRALRRSGIRPLYLEMEHFSATAHGEPGRRSAKATRYHPRECIGPPSVRTSTRLRRLGARRSLQQQLQKTLRRAI